MSSNYTTSSGAVQFTAMTESWAESASSEIDVIGFPGGDNVAISISGQREVRRTFKALFASSLDYRTMRGLRAKTGTLFVENWDLAPVNAVLATTNPNPPQVDGQVIAQVEFILF